MAVWIVRAGRAGERESLAIDSNMVAIGWGELPNLDSFAIRSDLQQACSDTYPNVKQKTLYNWVGQLWAFKELIKEGDMVVLPMKTQHAI